MTCRLLAVSAFAASVATVAAQSVTLPPTPSPFVCPECEMFSEANCAAAATYGGLQLGGPTGEPFAGPYNVCGCYTSEFSTDPMYGYAFFGNRPDCTDEDKFETTQEMIDYDLTRIHRADCSFECPSGSPTSTPAPSPPCVTQDSDTCLQAAGWGHDFTCQGKASFCQSQAKDMQRCCPITCGTGPLSEEACENLQSLGTCLYPNDAQCPVDEVNDRCVLPDDSVLPDGSPCTEDSYVAHGHCLQGVCTGVAVYTSNFELGATPSSDGWIVFPNTGDQTFVIGSGAVSPNTGPQAAATGTHYAYADAHGNHNKRFDMEKAFPEGHELYGITFQYHMYGSDIGSASLESSINGFDWTNLWFESGNKGTLWQRGTVYAPSHGHEMLRFIYNSGSGNDGNFALDDIHTGDCLTVGCNSNSNRPCLDSNGCDSATGYCSYSPDGTPCDDKDASTHHLNTQCHSGICIDLTAPTASPVAAGTLRPTPSTHYCDVQDSDSCLQEVYPGANTCSSYASQCSAYAKDMHRCCPITCGTGYLSQDDCNALISQGTCVYPNAAQTCTRTDLCALQADGTP